MEEVDELDRIGVDAVVGMAIYTGRMSLPVPTNRIGSGMQSARSSCADAAMHAGSACCCCSSRCWPRPARAPAAPAASSPNRTPARTSACSPARSAAGRSAPPPTRRARLHHRSARLFGFDVRVQEADAARAELGRTARVSNIIAVLPGSRSRGHRPRVALRFGRRWPGAATMRSAWRVARGGARARRADRSRTGR